MTRRSLFVLTLVVLIVLPRSDAPMTAAGQQRTRPQTPAPTEFFEVHERSILDLQAAQVEGRVTSRGLVDAYLARIAAYDQSGPRLNAIVVLNPRARDEAEALDRERARTGTRGPLHGIPEVEGRVRTRRHRPAFIGSRLPVNHAPDSIVLCIE